MRTLENQTALTPRSDGRVAKKSRELTLETDGPGFQALRNAKAEAEVHLMSRAVAKKKGETGHKVRSADKAVDKGDMLRGGGGWPSTPGSAAKPKKVGRRGSVIQLPSLGESHTDAQQVSQAPFHHPGMQRIGARTRFALNSTGPRPPLSLIADLQQVEPMTLVARCG